ncbi:MAG TPA: hypothetical protein VFZ48_04150 [Candidatus Saccharimonadales bacterium]
MLTLWCSDRCFTEGLKLVNILNALHKAGQIVVLADSCPQRPAAKEGEMSIRTECAEEQLLLTRKRLDHAVKHGKVTLSTEQADKPEAFGSWRTRSGDAHRAAPDATKPEQEYFTALDNFNYWLNKLMDSISGLRAWLSQPEVQKELWG